MLGESQAIEGILAGSHFSFLENRPIERQSYDFEDIRVLAYKRLHNMAVLVNAVGFFTAVVHATRIKLEILATHLLKTTNRPFGIPDFRLYAFADGIREDCARSHSRSGPGAKDRPQLTLEFGWDF